MMLGTFAPRESSAAEPVVVTKVHVVGQFEPADKKGKKARGVSGMACLGKATDASRQCLVIDDELGFGEIANLTGDGLVIAHVPIPLVRKGQADEGILGVARNPMCGGNAKADEYGELDGEGVAIAGDWVYLASSHSCSGEDEYKPSSYLLVRFKANSPTSFKGVSPVAVERSWRLADVLRASDGVGKFYGQRKGEGTNIEGLAVIGDRLYAGLRTPVDSDEAFIVGAPVADLFAADPTDHPEGLKAGVEFKPIRVRLGANTGIRDLAALRDGRMLILSGPTDDKADEAGVPYKLWLLEKPVSGKPQDLNVTITTPTKDKKGKRAKAEAVTVLDETSDRLQVLVLFDNIDEGEPTQYDIPLKP